MLDKIKEQIPDALKDVRLNVSKVLDMTQTDGLNESQILGSALAVAYFLGDQELINALKDSITNESLIQSAEVAAGLMAMTNIYYRFTHLTENPEIEQLPAGLRMQAMMNPGVDRETFESMCLAVSAINGCGTCVSSHTRQLIEHGFSTAAIARVGRISAVIHAVNVVRREI